LLAVQKTWILFSGNTNNGYGPALSPQGATRKGGRH